MKVFRFGKRLTDKTGANDLPIHHEQAAVGLSWKKKLRHPRYCYRIDQTGQDGKNQNQSKARTQFFQHVLLLYARPTATTSLSIIQIPGKGTMMPPSP